MFSDTFPDVFLAEKRNDYLDEDIPDEEDTNATPASPIPSQPSRSLSSSPSPLANKSHAPPQHSMPAWDMSKTMCLAGTGLEQLIAAADDAIPPEGLPSASVRAGGEGRRAGLKRRAAEITRSAAEDFALLTTRTSSMRRYAADFLSTVATVSFRDVYLK
jgi:hypothetical protein